MKTQKLIEYLDWYYSKTISLKDLNVIRTSEFQYIEFHVTYLINSFHRDMKANLLFSTH